ncbi:MAG: pyridoxal-dependent decarboxylase [Clostridiales bacterium]|nr:pyridoxal-dependent decarboxylase [Clostridiales bacterium]
MTCEDFKDSILAKAYSSEDFNDTAQKTVDIIYKNLKETQTTDKPKTIDYLTPEEQYRFWKEEFNSKEKTDFISLAEKFISHSINFHSKGYMGHQVAVTLPITALTSALTAYMNNCTTVYELGMAGNAMEKVIIEHLAEKYGYQKGSAGFITSGGSMGNLTALITARTSSGVCEDDFGRLAVIVSEEAHYSVERAAKIMGIKSENIIKIPVNKDFSMKTELLETAFQKAEKEGKIVFCIVGCACTTSVGAYDDFNAISDFAEKHKIWFHIDGAHGGAAIFSDKYKYLLKGSESSDSLIVDFHKMMMTPPLSTALIYNCRNRHINEFSPKANYLWQDQLSNEWYNSAKHTLECTKPVSVFHTYTIMRLYGDEIYKQNVDRLFDLGKQFAEMIKSQNDMEIALEPKSNIVCFRYLPKTGSADIINKKIAEELLRDGSFYVVSTAVKNSFYLRVTIMNPLTTADNLADLLTKIKETAYRIENFSNRKGA